MGTGDASLADLSITIDTASRDERKTEGQSDDRRSHHQGICLELLSISYSTQTTRSSPSRRPTSEIISRAPIFVVLPVSTRTAAYGLPDSNLCALSKTEITIDFQSRLCPSK